MKKNLLPFLLIPLLFFASCGPHLDTSPPRTCNDYDQPLTLQLNWSNAFYSAGFNMPGGTNPPFGIGDAYNNPNTPSQPSVPNNVFQYYCNVIVQSACTKSGGSTYNKTYLWTPGGPSLQIKTLTNEPTSITVEYYVGCRNFTTSTTTTIKHPYFVGVTTVPAGAPTVTIQMTTQTEKPC